VISPAFQWAQSLDQVMFQIKFSQRWDSPGCLDTFNQEVKMDNRTFNFTIYCRIATQLLKYELNLDLFGDINPQNSTVKLSSVGRAMVYLDKTNKPERWRRLTNSNEKLKNGQTWWEQFEKYEDELLKHTTFETDDNMDQFIHIENSPKRKPQKKQKRRPRADGEEKKSEL